jgi:hypothetical protein
MGSEPRFVSGRGFQAVRPLFHWGFAQSETKRVFLRMSLGKRRASPPPYTVSAKKDPFNFNGLGASNNQPQTVAPANRSPFTPPQTHSNRQGAISHTTVILSPSLFSARLKAHVAAFSQSSDGGFEVNAGLIRVADNDVPATPPSQRLSFTVPRHHRIWRDLMVRNPHSFDGAS